MKLFTAKVVWYPDPEDWPPEEEPATDYMVIAAEDFGDANYQITDHFGEYRTETIELTAINPRESYARIPKEVYEGLQKEAET